MVRITALLVLLFAVAPNVLYLGHGVLSAPGAHAHEPHSSEEHAAHCHGDTSGCSGAASTGLAVPPAPLALAAGAALLALASQALQPAVPAPAYPPKKPPRGTTLLPAS